MGYYPIFLELEGRPCLVVGGGEVAQRKAEGLLAAGARVTVISPRLTAEMESLKAEGRIRHLRRGYAEGDLEGFELCLVATDDPAVSTRVVAEARCRRLWVNVADDPARCDFILPSVVRRGDVALAVSTGGASPALARRLREELEAFLTEDTPALAKLLGEVRRELREQGISPEPDAWQQAIDGELRALLVQRRYRQARARLLAALGVEAEAGVGAPSEV